MGRKYLEDANIKPVGFDCGLDDERQLAWADERETYGFDVRETWSLDYSMVVNLFERTSMYLDVAPKMIDLETHKFQWRGVEYTQLEAIELLLNLCREYFKADDAFGTDSVMTKDIWSLWAEISPAMWW